jgi:protein gp37
MNPNWARALRDQCERYGVPFHFKQWGTWLPASQGNTKLNTRTIEDGGGKPIVMVRVNKKRAGRALDGRYWDEIPDAA